MDLIASVSLDRRVSECVDDDDLGSHRNVKQGSMTVFLAGTEIATLPVYRRER